MKIGVNMFNYIKAGVDTTELAALRKEGKPLTKYMKDGEMSIYLYHIQHRKIIKHSTGEKINPKDWDFKNYKVKSSHPDSMYLNNRLETIVSNYKKLVWEGLKQENGLTIEEVKELMTKSLSDTSLKPTTHTFDSVFDEFFHVKLSHDLVKPETMKKFTSTRMHLGKFSKQYNYPIRFNTITTEFEMKFRKYMATDGNLVNDSANKYMKSLKTFMKWAFEKNYHTNNDYEKFKTVYISKNDIVTLTQEELMHLQTFDLKEKPKRWSQVRDMYVFLCYTGQRFKDMMKLRWADLNLEEKEWNLYQSKGNKEKMIRVPLHHVAITILKRFQSDMEDEEYVFPQMCNVHANRLIQDVCKTASIDNTISKTRYKGKLAVKITNPKYEFISFHTARRTFVTLSLLKGMSPENVMQITGHEDYKTMKLYINITSKDARDSFYKVWE